MSDNFIKNPSRDVPRPAQSFEPEYQRLNITPIKRGADVHEASVFSVDDPMLHQHDSTASQDIDTSSMRNTGYIDNNDDVFAIYRQPSMGKRAQAPSPVQQKPQAKTMQSNSPSVGDYILMVNGRLILSGEFGSVEKRVKSILYKEDQEYKDEDITIDDIVVLKRVEIKIGVFIGS